MLRRLVLLLAGLALAGLVAAACGGEEKAAPTSAPAATAKPAATAVPAATPTKAPEPTKPPPTATAAPTQAPTATAKPAGPTGNFVLGEIVIDPPVFMPSKQGTGNMHLMLYWGFFEPVTWAKYSEPPKLNTDGSTFNEGTIQSWSIAPDSSAITMKVRKGIQFHRNAGELDAFDVCFSMNDAIRQGSTHGRAAGIQRFVSGFECPDASTVVMKIKDNKIDPLWYQVIGNNGSGSPVIVSKKLYDKIGEAEFTATPVGTGVMEPTEWLAGDRITAKPFAQHYRAVPKIASYRVVQMPEPSTRIAALNTGQVSAARVPLKLISNTKKDIPGSWSQVLGPPTNQAVMFGGNYWADKDPATGEDIYRKRPGFKPDADHPWIGDPADPASMEKARKVRLALSLAIDRDAIVKEIQSGISKTLYTLTNAFPGDPHWSDDFKVLYNVTEAKKLLTDAGYPNCFPFTFFVPPDNPGIEAEVGGAVAQFWRQLGCNVTVDASAYAAVRPLLVQRKRDNPWLFHAGGGSLPDANPAANFRPSPGFNYAIEVPIEISDIGFRNLDLAKTTFEQRVANNKEWQAYMTKWTLFAPVSTLPTTLVLRPEVTAYNPYMIALPEFVAPETLVMSK